MGKMDEAVGMKNRVMVGGGGKQIVFPFKRQELWKFIDCLISEFTYGNKGKKLWSELPKNAGKMAPNKLKRDVCGDTDLYKVCCDLYSTFCIYACH